MNDRRTAASKYLSSVFLVRTGNIGNRAPSVSFVTYVGGRTLRLNRFLVAILRRTLECAVGKAGGLIGDNPAVLSFYVVCLVWSSVMVQAPTVKILGDVPKPVTLTATELAAMPRTRVTASAHNQKGVYEGVTVRELLSRAGVPAGEALRGAELAKTVIVTGADGYRVAFGLAEFDPAFTDGVSILADRKDGVPLGGNAAPFQLILTDEKRPARWVRQVVSIEVVPPSSQLTK